MRWTLICAGLMLGGLSIVNHASAQSQCETIVIHDAQGGVTNQLTCRGTDGVWRPAGQAGSPAASQQTTNAFSPDFRGQVTYSGNYRAQIHRAGKSPSGGFNVNNGGIRFNFNNLLDSGTTTQIGGPINLTIDYNGSQVHLAYRAAGGLNPDSINGTRSGDTCRFVDSTSEYNAHCGPDGLVANFGTFQGLNPSIQGSLQAGIVKIADYAELERQQAAATAEANRERTEAEAAADRERAEAEAEANRKKAEADRKKAEFEAFLKSRPAASQEVAEALSGAVYDDSAAWPLKSYDAGSVKDVIVLKSESSGVQQIRGNYTHDGGQRSWVQAEVINNKVQCLQYEDSGDCAPVSRLTKIIGSGRPKSKDNSPDHASYCAERWRKFDDTHNDVAERRAAELSQRLGVSTSSNQGNDDKMATELADLNKECPKN